jgi:hypothetical protein
MVVKGAALSVEGRVYRNDRHYSLLDEYAGNGPKHDLAYGGFHEQSQP